MDVSELTNELLNECVKDIQQIEDDLTNIILSYKERPAGNEYLEALDSQATWDAILTMLCDEQSRRTALLKKQGPAKPISNSKKEDK